MQVAIVGAGICGLTLAATLTHQGAHVISTIYEADTSADSRSQGYAIGLKDESGLGVLTHLSLRAPLLAKGASRIRTFHITDQHGKTLLSAGANKGDTNRTYRVNRRDIKAILHAIADGAVQYGKQCIRYAHEANHVRLFFADGTTTVADYVIGCDGAGSRLREQMLPTTKHYVGLTSIYGDALLDVRDEPLLDEGFFITLGENGTSLLAYKQPGGVLFSYAFKSDQPETVDALRHDALFAQVRAGTAHWHDLVQRIVAGIVPDSLGTRPFYDWVPETTLQHGRVLLIGDAAHPMTPFQGQAANVGMLDAYEVGSLLAEHADDQKSLAKALAKQATQIRKRGRKAVLESRQTGLDFHLTSPKEQARRALIFRGANALIHVSVAAKKLWPGSVAD